MRYEFATAGRVVVGPGRSGELPEMVKDLGRQAFLVQGGRAAERGGPAAALARQLFSTGLVRASYPIPGEPDIQLVEEGARLAREYGCDLVIGIGGGSVMDASKAIAGLAANPGGALDYMEVVGAGKPLEAQPLPVVAVPTTAGTGTEVTRNAVITAPEKRVKASIRSMSLLPRLALVDSSLTHDLPPPLTARSGLDALTQLMEGYVCRRAQPITDGACLEGMGRASWALRRAYYHPEDSAAREAMSTASLLSGMALANAGLGVVHGFAAPLGGAFGIPHGAACAAMLPHVTAMNIHALRRRDPSGPALPRYVRIAEILLGRRSETETSTLKDLVSALQELVLELQIPRLSSYGITVTDIPSLAAQAARTSSTRGNPLDLEPQEMEEIVRMAL